MFCLCFYSRCVVLVPHHCALICSRTALCFSFKLLNLISVADFECFLVYMCPSDVPTTLPPSTTPPLHPIPADPTALLGTRASDPALPGNGGTVPADTSPAGPFPPSFTFPSALLQLSSQNVSLHPVNVLFYFCYSNFMSEVWDSLSHCIQKGVFPDQILNLLSPGHFWDFSTSVPANLKEANVRSRWKCLATGDIWSSFRTLRSRSDNSDSKSSFWCLVCSENPFLRSMNAVAVILYSIRGCEIWIRCICNNAAEGKGLVLFGDRRRISRSHPMFSSLEFMEVTLVMKKRQLLEDDEVISSFSARGFS